MWCHSRCEFFLGRTDAEFLCKFYSSVHWVEICIPTKTGKKIGRFSVKVANNGFSGMPYGKLFYVVFSLGIPPFHFPPPRRLRRLNPHKVKVWLRPWRSHRLFYYCHWITAVLSDCIAININSATQPIRTCNSFWSSRACHQVCVVLCNRLGNFCCD